MGGFGMIPFKEVIDSIRCRQLGKMFDNSYTHPLKQCILRENKSFASWMCLKESADSVAKVALELLQNNLCKIIRSSTNDEIRTDNLLIHRIGEIETTYTVKINKRLDNEAMMLVHHWGCNNLKEIIVQSRQNRAVLAICRRIMIAKLFRILKLMHQRNIDPQMAKAEKIRLAGKNFKNISIVTSKEFRLLLYNNTGLNSNKLGENIDEHTSKSYFAQIKS
jgi:hypothetical protein